MQTNNFPYVVTSLTLFILSLTMTLNAAATPPHPGPQFVDKHGCQHCHIIGGTGSVVAPPLDGIGKYRTKAYIVEKLTSPKVPQEQTSYPVPAEMMSHIKVSPVEAQFIAEYLTSLSDKNFRAEGHGTVPSNPRAPSGSHFAPEPASPSSNRGMKFYWEMGCIACHAIGPTGGRIGPNLAGVGARRARNYITERVGKGALLLPKPNQASGSYAMPPAKLNPQQIEDLTNWLMTLPVEKASSTHAKE